jgi:hypothetical protein
MNTLFSVSLLPYAFNFALPRPTKKKNPKELEEEKEKET